MYSKPWLNSFTVKSLEYMYLIEHLYLALVHITLRRGPRACTTKREILDRRLEDTCDSTEGCFAAAPDWNVFTSSTNERHRSPGVRQPL